MYYVEYRHDDNTMPVSWRFFKKAFKKKKQYQTSLAKIEDSQVGTMAQIGSINLLGKSKLFEEKEMEQEIYKFFDQKTNEQFTHITKKLVQFIEKAYQIKVRKLIAKFIICQNLQIYFLGCHKLYIELIKTGTDIL